MRYKHFIFDLDGTLSNPSAGICNGFRYAFNQLDISLAPDFDFKPFIGLPLQQSLKANFFRDDERKLWEAVNLFREYYSQKGLFENYLYDGVIEMLEKLKSENATMYVATNKPQPFAIEILRHFKIQQYFKTIKGINPEMKEANKEELVKEILLQNKIKNTTEVVLIGDTRYDILCGRFFNIDTVSVGYGFGTEADLLYHKPTRHVYSVPELQEYLTTVQSHVAL